MNKLKTGILLVFILSLCATVTRAQHGRYTALDPQQQSIIRIAANTAKGELVGLKTDLTSGLEAGLTVNQIKEVLVHVYAYAGFPRSIRGLQTFMTLIEDRKASGINDPIGADATPIKYDKGKYERGKAILEELTGTAEKDLKTGYAAFAPTIEIFLKEHLFADIFERDILTYQQRELATIAAIASIGRAEPMLKSHLTICLHVGLSAAQLNEFSALMKDILGKKEAKQINTLLQEIISTKTTS